MSGQSSKTQVWSLANVIGDPCGARDEIERMSLRESAARALLEPLAEYDPAVREWLGQPAWTGPVVETAPQSSKERLQRAIDLLTEALKPADRTIGCVKLAREHIFSAMLPDETPATLLSAAWLKYGRHLHDCQRYGPNQCTCGFVETCTALAVAVAKPVVNLESIKAEVLEAFAEAKQDHGIPTDRQLLDQLQDAFYLADSGYVERDVNLRKELATLLAKYNRGSENGNPAHD